MPSVRRAVLRVAGQPLEVESFEPLPCRGDQVRMQVLATGVCRTDAHIVSGADPIALPRVLGHEVAGRVDGLGNVVVYGAFGCRSCLDCAAGNEQLCPWVRFLGRTVDGGFPDQVVVPSAQYCVALGDLDPLLAAADGVSRSSPQRAVAATWRDGGGDWGRRRQGPCGAAASRAD